MQPQFRFKMKDCESEQVFFISDTHFNHKAIIGFSNRPFADVAEMNDAMALAWNAVVGPKDVVWHLGDVAKFGSDEETARYLRKLNGTKYLILGNHDNSDWGFGTKSIKEFVWVGHYAELQLLSEGTEYGSFEVNNLVLTHYPLASWNGSFSNESCNLHGHCHGTMPPIKRRVDIGVDGHPGYLEPAYAPKRWSEIFPGLRKTIVEANLKTICDIKKETT